MKMAYWKKEIAGLEDYSVLQEKGMIKMNQNESPYEIPLSLKRTTTNLWLNSDWARYPKLEDHDLLKCISRYAGHLPDGILLGVGSNELLLSLFLTFLEKGKKLLVPDPCFSIYSRLGKILQAEIIYSRMNRNFQYDSGDILKIIKKTNPDLAVFPSPHNPCGDILERQEVEEMLKAGDGILVMDEAYFEFSGNTVLELLDRFENLLILRTFSKAFGLAGLRAGYLLGDPKIINLVRKAQMPFSVSSFNQLALACILKHPGYVTKIVNHIIREREKMSSSLSRIKKIRAYPSSANFILFEIKDYPAMEIFKRLKERNILLRSFDAPQLKNCLRVTLGRKLENRIFIKTLKEIMNELCKE